MTVIGPASSNFLLQPSHYILCKTITDTDLVTRGKTTFQAARITRTEAKGTRETSSDVQSNVYDLCRIRSRYPKLYKHRKFDYSVYICISGYIHKSCYIRISCYIHISRYIHISCYIRISDMCVRMYGSYSRFEEKNVQREVETILFITSIILLTLAWVVVSLCTESCSS